MPDTDILFLIVARGGSKGVPRKNLREIGGLSLVGFKANSARQSQFCSRLIISTEDAEIRAEGERWGAEAPFVRPAELASDAASSSDVVRHAMNWVEEHEGRRYAAIMLLEPASPFARADHYDAAVQLYRERSASLVVGMREVDVASMFIGPLRPDGSIGHIVEKFAAASGLRRQDQPPEATMNGAFYLIDWRSFERTGMIYGDAAGSYGIVMDPVHSIEIETPLDLAYAEFAVERGLIDIGHWKANSGRPNDPRAVKR